MRLIIVLVVLIAVYALVFLRKRDYSCKDVSELKKETDTMESILVPDNVKEEAQPVSTQHIDAKVYNVEEERQKLVQKENNSEEDSVEEN